MTDYSQYDDSDDENKPSNLGINNYPKLSQMMTTGIGGDREAQYAPSQEQRSVSSLPQETSPANKDDTYSNNFTQLLKDKNSIDEDLMKTTLNPNYQGPRQDIGTILPAQRAMAEQSLAGASVGSLNSGMGPKDIPQRLQNLKDLPGNAVKITKDKINSAGQMLNEIMQRPNITQEAKMQALQKFNSYVKKAKNYGIVD